MKTIPLICPACKRGFDVPASKDGKDVECPDCLEVFKAEKPGAGPQVMVVVLDGSKGGRGKGGKAKSKPRRRDDDDDDDHDHDHPPERSGGGGGYHAIRSPGTTLTLGILSLGFFCVPLVGLILAIVAMSGPAAAYYHPADRGTVRTGKLLAQLTLGLYVLAILAVGGYFART